MTYVSFPGLGIENIKLNPVIEFPFGLEIHWYGVLISIGMVLAVLYALWHAKFERVKSDDIIDLALYLIVFGILGARFYYVIMEFDAYIVSDGSFFHNLIHTLYNCIAIWKGGLAIYGGIIAGVITGFVYARIKRIRFPVIADIAGPSVLIGQIIGRWGNFVNIEAFGGPTALPWRMCSEKIANDFLRKGLVDEIGYEEVLNGVLGAHPTFLYESLWNLAGLTIITCMYKRKKFHGQMFIAYMMWYGLGRALIESLRTDSLEIGDMRVSQFVGFATFVLGVILMVMNLRRVKGKKEESYTAVYAKAAQSGEEPSSKAEEDKEETTEETTEKENEHGTTD